MVELDMLLHQLFLLVLHLIDRMLLIGELLILLEVDILLDKQFISVMLTVE